MLDLIDNNDISGTSHQTPHVNPGMHQTLQENRQRPQRQRNVSGCGTGGC